MIPLRSLPPTLAHAYGLTPADFTWLAAVQNTVFSFSKNGAELVLRLTPETHRPFERVQAEIEWLGDLSTQKIHMAAPLPAEDGSLCRRIEWDNQTWTAVAFARAPGRIGAAEDWTAKTFRAWGAMTARLHLASENYQNPPARRPDWKQLLPDWEPEGEDEHLARKKLDALIGKIDALPFSSEHFGLIHSDLHFWNFSVDDTGLTVFDFDNCEYHWFLADVGTIVFEAATCIHQRLPRQEFLVAFLSAFLDGYRGVRSACPLLSHLPDFAKLREILIFLILSRRWKNREIGPFKNRSSPPCELVFEMTSRS
jgi:Ser/Thr protein kinase RdoA (MazF antagonist)